MKKKNYETVEIEMSDELFLFVAKEAHKKDITFNKMIEFILLDFIEKTKDMSDKDIKKMFKG